MGKKKQKAKVTSTSPVSSGNLMAYCMKCRTKREVKGPKPIVHSNGKHAITGVCSACGTKIFRMGKMPGTQPAAPAAVDVAPVEATVSTEAPGSYGKGRSKVKIS